MAYLREYKYCNTEVLSVMAVSMLYCIYSSTLPFQSSKHISHRLFTTLSIRKYSIGYLTSIISPNLEIILINLYNLYDG